MDITRETQFFYLNKCLQSNSYRLSQPFLI